MFKFKKPTKRQWIALIRYMLIVMLGNAIAAAASVFFIVPNNLVMGGTTGLGIFVRNLLGGNKEWVVTLTVWIANVALFLLGSFLLGKKFAAGTLAGTLLYPAFMSIFTLMNDAWLGGRGLCPTLGVEEECNTMLAVLMGGLLFGGGVGIVVRIGASTGGTDIPPLIFQKYFNLPLGVGASVCDMSIVILQFAAKMSIINVLYGIVITLVSSIVVDKVSVTGARRTQVKIISRKYKEIRAMILNELNRGVTMLYGKTGFLQDDCYVLLTIVSNRDVVRLKNKIQAIDPEAFLTISEVAEVHGRGFSSDRVVLPKEHLKEDLVEVVDEENINEQDEKRT